MNMNSADRRERGIAMMIVLFALLLLSVVGLGMMYSTNMETSINGNYRDKQVSFYAALAGLQEGRQRMQYPYNITPPSALPSTSATNVIYIVSNASTVQPWNSSNTYFDTELCQENVLNLTGTAGVPCTTTASGTTWYQYFDDSLAASTPWNLTNPLDLKWVRITMKANNTTPYAVNGNSADSSEACWNGANEMSTPTSYTTGCKPTGGVTAINVITSGGSYTSAPSVMITGGGGSGAAATATIQQQTTGYVASISLTTGGSGYTTAPTVTIAGDGTGATAMAQLSTTGTTTTSGSVVSVTLSTGGSGYTTAPAVTLSGDGTGATATATLSTTGTTVTTGYVNVLTLSGGGTGYTSAPTVSFSGGGGSGAAATATLGTSGEVVSVSVSSVGTQCFSQASDVVVTFSGGSGSGATATGVLETTRSCIYSWTAPLSPQCNNKLSSANGYSPADQKAGVTFNDVGNKSFSGTLAVRTSDEKSPISFSVQNPGYDSTGYSTATFNSTLTLTSGPWPTHSGAQDCNNITATATTGYRLASITVANGGSGYTSAPAVTITGGTGSTSEPTATATAGFPVASLTLSSGGTNYTSNPTVSFSGGGGGCSVCTNAAATATVVTTSSTVYPVAYVTVTAGGSGYTSAAVAFSGGGGSGAAGTAAVSATTVTTYSVASVTVNGNGGSSYTTATVSFSGGGGSGAAATATLGSRATGTYSVSAISVNTAGSGYTSDPTVTICGTDTAGANGCSSTSGPGSGATATSQISGGTKYGQVYLVTALAQTLTGARSMLQMEVASPVLGFATGGALTIDGPNPTMDAMPNSSTFTVKGTDANSCNQTADATHPAIDGYDDPNANPPTNSVTTITNSLPRPANYTGSGGTPSVQNGYAALGETMTTPTGLDSVISAIYNTSGANHYSNNPGSIALGSCPTGIVTDPTCQTVIDYVNGNLSLGGSSTGYGILVVTGTLTMSGNFSWDGLVFVVGDGNLQFSGGGNGQINGSLVVAKIWDGWMTQNLLNAIGSPTIGWNGGGGNGIQYDHCWTTDLMNAVPFTPPPSTKPLKTLSFRILPY